MDNLLGQEQRFQFADFKNEYALMFAQNVLDLVKKEKYKNVRIRVTYRGDIIFQYLMSGKTGVTWLDKKEATVMKSGHSSLYVFYHQEDFLQLQDNRYSVFGGAFPLIENGEVQGAFCISGLTHEEDHRLLIGALEKLWSQINIT